MGGASQAGGAGAGGRGKGLWAEQGLVGRVGLVDGAGIGGWSRDRWAEQGLVGWVRAGGRGRAQVAAPLCGYVFVLVATFK